MNSFIQSIYFTLRLRIFRWWILAAFIAIPVDSLLQRLVGTLLHSSGSLLSNMPLVEAIATYHSYSGGPLFVTSVTLGGCQWLVLRRYFSRAYGWLIATMAGGAIATLIYSFSLYGLVHLTNAYAWTRALPSFEYRLAEALGLGLGIGLTQWLFLRSRVRQAYRWIVAVFVAQFAIALLQTVPLFTPHDPFIEALSTGQLAPTPHPITAMLTSTLKRSLTGILTAIFQSVPTGWVLSRFIAQQKCESITVF